jgi:CubicO group peptidase (beta-lactamase class C family)
VFSVVFDEGPEPRRAAARRWHSRVRAGAPALRSGRRASYEDDKSDTADCAATRSVARGLPPAVAGVRPFIACLRPLDRPARLVERIAVDTEPRRLLARSAMSRRTALMLLAALLLSSCGDAAGHATRSYDFTAVEQAIQTFMSDNDLAGVGAIVVQRDDGVVFERSFGAFTDDRIYLLASSSKMITAGVLLRLADQGLLDMDAPVAAAVDWGSGNPAITPAQLVSNSSGLVGLLPNPTYPPYLCQYIYTGTLQDCARQIFTTTADDADVIPPDTQFRYGGAQWQVAGAVAEAVSGKSWADLIRETYSEPCGLQSLAYNNHFVQLSGGNAFTYPIGFDGNPGVLKPTMNPNMEGGAYTDIGDYAKLLLMHLRGGRCGGNRVLSEAAVERMHTDRIAQYGGSTGNSILEGYGMGWWIDRDSAIIADPGAYGAFPWIDQQRGYGAFLALEDTSQVGGELFAQVAPLIAAAVDAAR